MRFSLLFCVVAACSPAPAVKAPVAAAAPAPPKDPCKEAARLRRAGFDKMLNLDLKGAREEFNRSLQFDPGNTGAVQQLQVIDAMESGSDQAGAAESNNGLNSQVVPSKCQEAGTKPQSARVPPAPAAGVADTDGQIGLSALGDSNGLVTPSVVHATVSTAKPKLSECYASALQSEPALHGEVVVHFRIDGDGHVVDPELEGSTLTNANMESCISSIVAGLEFPESRGEHDVSYPLSFR